MCSNDSAQQYMANANNLVSYLNTAIMDPTNRFNKEQMAKLLPKLSELLGTIGQMGIKLGIMEGELGAYKQIIQNQPLQSNNQLTNNAPNLCEALDEIEDRKTRSKNIILFNVPESQSPTQAQCIADDTNRITGILNKVTPLDANKIKLYRLGAKRSDKTRPIKIEFGDESQAKFILQNRNVVSNEVKIKCDQTLLQRKQLSDLRKELEDRLQGGEVNLTIKYINSCPKIISTLPKN